MSHAHPADTPLGSAAASNGGAAAIAADAAAAAARLPPDLPVFGTPLTLPVLEDHDDRPRDLSRIFAGVRVLLTFYLGGWSEPCTAALRELESRRVELGRRGVAIVAVTADGVERIAAVRSRIDCGFLAVHDHGSRFAHALGLSFRISTEARAALRADGIRLADWTGAGVRELPLPATLLIDADRTVTPFLDLGSSGLRLDVADAIDAALSA